jgi:hypothetical protein
MVPGSALGMSEQPKRHPQARCGCSSAGLAFSTLTLQPDQARETKTKSQGWMQLAAAAPGRRLPVLAAAVTAVLATAGPLAGAASARGGGSSSSAALEPQTISVLEVDTAFAGTGGYDVASHAPPSAGQGITFSGSLYKWSGTKRGAAVGHIEVICTVTSSGEGALCNGVMLLPSGVLEVLGPTSLTGDAPSNIAVVGGTGSYVGAQGYIRTANIGPRNGSESADVIHLTG